MDQFGPNAEQFTGDTLYRNSTLSYNEYKNKPINLENGSFGMMGFGSDQITSKEINSLTNTHINLSGLNQDYALLGKTEYSSKNYTLSGQNSATRNLAKKKSPLVSDSSKKEVPVIRFENYENFNNNDNSDGSNFEENNYDFLRKGSNSSTSKLRLIDQEIQNIEASFTRGMSILTKK